MICRAALDLQDPSKVIVLSKCLYFTSEVAATEWEVRLEVASKQTMLSMNARNFGIFRVKGKLSEIFEFPDLKSERSRYRQLLAEFGIERRNLKIDIPSFQQQLVL